MLKSQTVLPVEIVFHPSWWHKHAGIVFDEDFFYNPKCRVESERRMEQELYQRFGEYGLGADHNRDLPQIGAVHNAAGYLLSEMLGCDVVYEADAPPQVICAHREDFSLEVDAAFDSKAFKRIEKLIDELTGKYGYVCGDINWGGILNLAIDLKGENTLMDIMLYPDEAKIYFSKIALVIERFFSYIQSYTGSNSISVNRIVRHFNRPITLHSECSHTMISEEDYIEFLLKYDIQWANKYQPFGIHYCGKDPHRHRKAFAQIPNLDFLDLGWGGDVKVLREDLPHTFFSLRLDPVTLNRKSHEELETIICDKVKESGNQELTGVCCINMDAETDDEKVRTIFKTVNELRKTAR